MEMTSNQPYLFRAIYEWIVDNGATPYMVVNAIGEDVRVPQQSIQNGQIVLNIAPRAVTNYQANDTAVSFSARFSGVGQQLYVPCQNILAIYAAENGQGMVFTPEQVEEASQDEVSVDNVGSSGDPDDTAPADISTSGNKPQKDRKSFLKVVK